MLTILASKRVSQQTIRAYKIASELTRRESVPLLA